MKKMFVLSTLIASAMICSCQKQNPLAEAQLAQRKTELDAREETLIQREKAVDEREKAVAEREKAVADERTIQPQRQAPDAAQAEAKRPDTAHPEAERLDATQAEAERQKAIQQLPPELQALIRDHSSLDSRAEIEKLKRGFEEERAKNMGAIAPPNAKTSDTQPTSSFLPSPTPE